MNNKFDIGKPRDDNGNMRPRRDPRGPQANDRRGPPRHTQMKPSQDWNSVWPAARTFHPAVVPLPVRQGAIQIKNQVFCSYLILNAFIMMILLPFTSSR